MVSLGNPLAGGAITSGGNAAIDIATGNVPSFKNPEDALLYLGKEAAFGAATSFAGAQAGKIIGPALSKLGNSVGGWFKHGFQTYAQESLQTVLINGKPITTSIEVGIKATKTYVSKALGSSVGNVVKTGNGSYYSVAYEMKLASSSYPGVYRGAHFLEANKALNTTMANDSRLASDLGIVIPKSPSGSILGKSPTNWVWHHDVGEGIMQLVPKEQHTVGSRFWSTLHPNGVGGFAIWGK